MSAPPMAYFGGKTRIADRIVAELPPHKHYVEPFAGSLAVLLAKRPAPMETVNDLDGDIMTFWRVLREQPDELARVCALTPHSRAEHASAGDTPLNDLDRARRVFTRINQGRAGVLTATGWRHFVKPVGTFGMPGYLDAYIDRMAAAAERMRGVSLECRPSLDLVGSYGAFEDVCLYLDPPYLASTRSSGSYQVEMGKESDHADLLDAALGCKASVLISGYASPLYDDALSEWRRVEVSAWTGQGGSRQERTEVLWCNRSTDLTLWDEAVRDD